MDNEELNYKMKQMQGESAANSAGLSSLEQRMRELEKHVHIVMRGPKGDRGEDGVDGHGFDLTEEDIKNAVRDGVVEGIQEFIEGIKYQG